MTSRRHWFVAPALAALACGAAPRAVSGDGATDTTTGDDQPLDPVDSWGTGVAFVARPDVGSSGDTTAATQTGGGEADGGAPFECDMFAQDCPDGEKCMPWARDGAERWNDTRCTPVAADAGQPGDACTVAGWELSGIDDCDVGVMCWDVDAETLQGTCVAMCQGDAANPICEDPDDVCTICSDCSLILCLPTCHPLEQDCPEGQACYPFNQHFLCFPDDPSRTGVPGEPCESINGCGVGSFCLDASAITVCESLGCCVPTCDHTDPTADATCFGFDPGTACEPWYMPRSAPDGYENVGVCVVPG